MTKPLSYLFDLYKWNPWKWSIKRNDELSGSGDGRFWKAQMAAPLWKAEVSTRRMPNTVSEQLDAALRYLEHTGEPFLMASPVFCFPHADPKGLKLGSAEVTLVAIDPSKRMALNLAGLPVGYRLSRGDKFSIPFGAGKVYFGEFSETMDAGLDGTLANIPVFPPAPFGLATGVTIDIVKPACPVVTMPESIVVSEVVGSGSSNTSFTIIQKK